MSFVLPAQDGERVRPWRIFFLRRTKTNLSEIIVKWIVDRTFGKGRERGGRRRKYFNDVRRPINISDAISKENVFSKIWLMIDRFIDETSILSNLLLRIFHSTFFSHQWFRVGSFSSFTQRCDDDDDDDDGEHVQWLERCDRSPSISNTMDYQHRCSKEKKTERTNERRDEMIVKRANVTNHFSFRLEIRTKIVHRLGKKIVWSSNDEKDRWRNHLSLFSRSVLRYRQRDRTKKEQIVHWTNGERERERERQKKSLHDGGFLSIHWSNTHSHA